MAAKKETTKSSTSVPAPSATSGKKEFAPAAEPPKKKSEPKKELEPEKKPESAKPAGTPCTFARWFRSKGFKPHWQAGMEAFRDTSGKKTPEEWEQIFKKY